MESQDWSGVSSRERSGNLGLHARCTMQAVALKDVRWGGTTMSEPIWEWFVQPIYGEIGGGLLLFYHYHTLYIDVYCM